MKKIGQGKYQKVYLETGLVYKYLYLDCDLKDKIFLTKKYFNELKRTNIPVPSEIKIKNQGSFIVTISEYCGGPLEQVLLKGDNNLVLRIYSEIINLGLRAFESRVAFYPKINQFTYKKGNIYFIDFYPSRTMQDFLNYSEEKRKSLGLVFYGLGQKILTPTNELIKLRGDLKDDILNVLKNITATNKKLSPFQKDIEQCLEYLKLRNRKILRQNKNFKGFVNLEKFTVLSPSGHVWTENLYKYDQKIFRELFF